jgi:hypothetical protein
VCRTKTNYTAWESKGFFCLWKQQPGQQHNVVMASVQYAPPFPRSKRAGVESHKEGYRGGLRLSEAWGWGPFPKAMLEEHTALYKMLEAFASCLVSDSPLSEASHHTCTDVFIGSAFETLFKRAMREHRILQPGHAGEIVEKWKLLRPVHRWHFQPSLGYGTPGAAHTDMHTWAYSQYLP